MSHPLVVAGLGGLALSGGANLYAQHINRQLYRRQIDAYRKAYAGYSRYLARHGRRINPTRGYLNYYGGSIDRARTSYNASLAGSYGSAAGAFGAGATLSRWL